MLIDVFADWSRVGHDQLQASVARLMSENALRDVSTRVTFAVSADASIDGLSLPPGWKARTSRPVEAFRYALSAAAADERPLLILLSDVEPGREAIGVLADALESDPMIGFAFPRLTGHADGSLARLDAAGDPQIVELPRRILAEIPDTYLVADSPARCLLVKPVIVTNFGDVEGQFRTVAGTLWHYMSRARRCGFRTVACNRAVVTARWEAGPCPPCTMTLPSLPPPDRALLRELAPDVERANAEAGTFTAAAAETRLARALPQAYGARPSLLLDVRNVIAGCNGTSVAALGISSGLHALRTSWEVTLLATRDACKFHELEHAFPDWPVETQLPKRQFTAALRLSQPWHIQEMVDLHGIATYNLYFFLDTISWDVVYTAPRHLGGTWQFMADHADAFLFNSAYTRDRFRRRFRVNGVPDLVAYHSFDPDEYALPAVRRLRKAERFIFVVGNQYDHKDIRPTTELLATAFPYESIVALGPAEATTPRVRVLQSGTVSDAGMHRLYADARVVVFPSFYEGFGFPILTTLAYGGTVVARQSPLLEEIAARCAPRGRIVPFTRRDALVDVVGRVLHDDIVESIPLGTALENGRPMSWISVGERILELLDALTTDLSRSRWRLRERTIEQLLAAPTSLVDKGLQQPGTTARSG